MTEDTFARLERLINERHVNLVDAWSAVIGGLHEDLIGLGQGQENLSQQIGTLGRAIEAGIRERNDALEMVYDQLRRLTARQDDMQQQIDSLGRRLDVHDRLAGLLRPAHLTDAPGD